MKFYAPSQTYKLDLVCKNCNEEKTYIIPQGQSVLEFVKHNKCTYCGCKKLSKEDEDYY